MNRFFWVNAIAVFGLIVISSATSPAKPRSRLLSENAALQLLQRTLKRDHAHEKRISWDCISYRTEETTDAYFEFVLREIHNAKCDGAPETSPAIDRYRVYRHSGKIEQWQATDDTWQPYKPGQNK